MKIALTAFVTLDRVYQGPGSPTEDTTDGFVRGGWLVPYIDRQFIGRTLDWGARADGLLLGRRTYRAFARDWPRIEVDDPDDPFAERMNALPKYVVSNTISAPTWGPVTVLTGDPVHSVGELKDRPGGELQIHGSGRLGNALLAAGLVDTVRLVVAPIMVGSGRRLLDGPVLATRFRLGRYDVTGSGLLLLEYELQGPAEIGVYAGVAQLVEGADPN
jgi:dihydrofolate reductase